MQKINKSDDAVSEILGLILVIFISVTAVSAVMIWGVVYMQQEKSDAAFESSEMQLNKINELIKGSIISQGFSSSNTYQFVTSNGQLSLKENGERFIIYYSLDQNFDFDVSDLEESDSDPDETNFQITINPPNDPSDYQAHIYYLYKNPVTDETIAINTPCTNSLHNTIKIDIEKDESGDISIYGTIWLFDLSYIKHQSTTNTGTKTIIIENGALMSNIGGGYYVFDKPNFYSFEALEGSNFVSIRIIDYDFEELSFSGLNTDMKIQFDVKNKNYYPREKKATIPALKIQIYGDSYIVDSWKNLFEDTYGFDEEVGYIELEGPFVFNLIHSIIEVDAKIIR